MSPARRLIIASVLALLGVLVAAGPGLAAAPPRDDLTQFSCEKALDPANRAVAVTSVMRPVAGTRRLAVKFDLLERTASSPVATAVHAPGLGVWITPTDPPTLGQRAGDVFRVEKSVLNLDAPASYQFRATFRWTGARGKVLGTATKLSLTCRQRELRPDLLVKSVAVSPISGHPDENLYAVVIADQGATGAGPFQVLFVPGDNSAPMTHEVQFLRAGQSRQLSFVGPVCDATSPPTVTVDATSVVDDFDRTNNSMTVACPASTSS